MQWICVYREKKKTLKYIYDWFIKQCVKFIQFHSQINNQAKRGKLYFDPLSSDIYVDTHQMSCSYENELQLNK